MSVMTRFFSAGLLIFSAAGLLFGQAGASGTILGTVSDNCGAVVANARVDVRNTATGVRQHTTTTTSGDYSAPYLQPGIYSVTVEAPAFRSLSYKISPWWWRRWHAPMWH
jgi:hypothetical protein